MNDRYLFKLYFNDDSTLFARVEGVEKIAAIKMAEAWKSYYSNASWVSVYTSDGQWIITCYK